MGETFVVSEPDTHYKSERCGQKQMVNAGQAAKEAAYYRDGKGGPGKRCNAARVHEFLGECGHFKLR
jgi:hypothetical protein